MINENSDKVNLCSIFKPVNFKAIFNGITNIQHDIMKNSNNKSFKRFAQKQLDFFHLWTPISRHFNLKDSYAQYNYETLK